MQVTVTGPWNDATIEMPDSLTIASVPACVDPSSESSSVTQASCSPDPLSNTYLVALKRGLENPNAAVARHEQLGMEVDFSTLATGDDGEERYVGHAPLTVLAGIQADADVAAVLRLGGSAAIAWWTEGGCGPIRMLTMGRVDMNGTGLSREIVPSFDAMSDDCGVTPLTVETSAPASGGSSDCTSECVSTPPCQVRSSAFSTSHTIQDPPNLDLSWLRSLHYVSWDGCNWIRFDDGYARSGHGYSWWHNDTPRNELMTGGQRSTIGAAFDTTVWSSGWAVPDCTISIYGTVVLNRYAQGSFVTSKTVYGGWPCHVALHSATSPWTLRMGDTSYWTGTPEDKIIQLTPTT